MKKVFVILIALSVLGGCSSISMKRTVNDVSREQVKSKMGDFTIVVMPLKKTYFNYIKTQDMQSQGSSDEVSDKLQSLQYRENQFFLFEIRHIDMYVIKKGDFTFSMTDVNGINQLDDIMYFEELFSDTVLGEMWILKTKKPITKENFGEGELPVTLNIQFLGQEMEYHITP